jgi:glycosyltransferase involved in cell wall biosynthesis
MDAALPPRVGINALFLEPRMGGIETYLRELVPELARLAPETDYVVYCSAGGRQYLEQTGWGDTPLRTHPLLGRRGTKALTELSVLGLIAGREVDLLHSVALTAPLRTRAANIVTLADVTWMISPDPGEVWTTRLWRVVVPPAARRADRVIVHSNAAAAHIVEHLRVPRERIDVIPHGQGVTEHVEPTPARTLRTQFNLGAGPVILTVSAKKIHKNLERLVRAMVAVVARWPAATLVLPGNPTAHEHELRRLAVDLGIAANVAFPPYVDAADLEGLYALADCFVFASLNEGFGLPVLEAMRRGVPVACSAASALPEIAGDAARYFDPLSVPDIGTALMELLADPELGARLAERGRVRQASFTWEAAARVTLESYARAWRERA